MKRRFDSFLLVFTLAFVGLMAASGLYSFWSDSEMWAATVARDLFRNHTDYDFTIKPLFHVVNWALFQCAQQFHVYPMYFGRGLAAVMSSACLYLVYCLVAEQTHSTRWSLLSVLFIASSQIFLDQGARLRSDIFAAAFILFGMRTLLREERIDSKKKGIAGSAFLIAFLLTPKSIYFLIPVLLMTMNHSLRWKLTWPSVAGLLAIVGSFFAMSGVKVLHYFTSTFTTAGFGASYFDPVRFGYVFRAIAHDPQIFLAVVFCTIRVGKSIRHRSLRRNEIRFAAMPVILSLILLIHPEKLPFFIYSLVPFIAVGFFVNQALATRFEKLLDQSWVGVGAVLIFTGVLWMRGLQRFEFLRTEHNNFAQVEMMDVLDRRFHHSPDLMIYDPVGIMPFANTRMWYLGPGEIDQRQKFIDIINGQKPDVILYAQRLDWLQPDIEDLLHRDYHDWGHGIFVRHIRMPFNPKKPFIAGKDVVERLRLEKPNLADKAPLFFYSPAMGDLLAQIFVRRPLSQKLYEIHAMTHKELETVEQFFVLSKTPYMDINWIGPLIPGLHGHLADLFRFDSDL